ncbi:MAG: hypothetical protein COW54_15345 [Rhodobacteraceae bacterium CG17_big_fil_post_rev_8_21_14_2_50_63_15]|nr:hypothetical protein [Roseovarius sp.]PIV77308.1 MAG: hypothetical protein COW54_15345 [Rhodobacteraceae bacterium CG17_big_fil_post_rev_8_21_14_2_50_63_15]
MKLRNVLQQEAHLRANLTALDAQRQASQHLSETEMHGVREIGADLLWLAWLGRNRADLQMQLARVLARKGHMMQGLRRAFGKHQAALKLRALDMDQDRLNTRSRQERDLAELAILRRTNGPSQVRCASDILTGDVRDQNT